MVWIAETEVTGSMVVEQQGQEIMTVRMCLRCR